MTRVGDLQWCDSWAFRSWKLSWHYLEKSVFFSNLLWFFLMKIGTRAKWHSCSGFKDLCLTFDMYLPTGCPEHIWSPTLYVSVKVFPELGLWNVLGEEGQSWRVAPPHELGSQTVKPEKRPTSASRPLPGCRCAWPAASGSCIHSHLLYQNSPLKMSLNNPLVNCCF